MINPYYFSDRALQVGFEITLDSLHISHANSILIFEPNYPEIEIRFVVKSLKEIATDMLE